MKISDKGLTLIKHFESLHDGNLTKIGLQPKMCPAGIWTIGYGRALKDEKGNWLKGEEGFKKLQQLYPDYLTITEEQAVEYLDEDCDEREDRLNSLKLNLNQDQFDALVSFIYNVGFGNLLRSSLLKRIKNRGNAYGSDERIKQAFMMWTKARVNGELIPLKGLIRRRKSEAELFLTGNLNFYQ